MSEYETDLLVWSEHQADLLRRMGAGERVNGLVDWEHLAEEIEDLGRAQRSALNSQVRRLLELLLKLAASPAIDPRNGWRETVRSAQDEIADILEANPSLRRELTTVIAAQLPRARLRAAESLADRRETPRVALASLQYDADAILAPLPPEAANVPGANAGSA